MTLIGAYLPAVLAVLGAVACMLLGAWGRRRAALIAAATGLALAALAPVVSDFGASAANTMWGIPTSALLTSACMLLGLYAVAGSFRTASADDRGVRVASLATLAVAAAALVATAQDVLTLFLAVETLAVLGYGLVALGQTDRARESAMKWFVQGSVSTVFFIVGIGVVLGVTGGSLTYAAIGEAARAAQGPGVAAVAVALVLIIAALAFKAGAFPFHSWMPDALESAPPAASAVLASVGKVAPLAAIAYLLGAQVLPGTRPASLAAVVTLVAGMACASIVFGNLAALRQKSFARMLGYSAIAQVGYGLVSVLYPGAVENTIVFAVLYALAALGSFLFIVAMREIDPEWDGSIAGLAGLSKRAPLLAASLAVLMLSLTGIPLTAGFWGKLFAFTNAYAGGALWLVVVAMLGSVVSFGYYGGVLRAAFMEEPPSDPAPVAPGRAGRAVVLIAALVLLAGIVPFIVTVAR